MATIFVEGIGECDDLVYRESAHKNKTNKIKFVLNGCDISFIAEAPEDITLKQLLKQCDKIEPDYCACGIRSIDKDDKWEVAQEAEILIGYDSVKKANEDVSCRIVEK